MPQAPSPSPNDCFHCPQGDKPCPVTYQPGAWLAQLPAEPAPATPDHRPGPGDIEATVQLSLRKVRGPSPVVADDPAGPAAYRQAGQLGGPAGGSVGRPGGASRRGWGRPCRWSPG
jgi:hypothetical protein